jgi:hypothetical protein
MEREARSGIKLADVDRSSAFYEAALARVETFPVQGVNRNDMRKYR